MRPVSRAVLALATLVWWPGSAARAQAVHLGLAGRAGPPVRAIAALRGTMVFREINEAGQAIGDSVVAEMIASAGIAYRVLEAQAGERLLEVRYDSLKSRARVVGQAWKEAAVSGTGRAVRIPTDERFVLRAGGAAELPPDPIAAGGIVSWHGVVLPARDVGAGETWEVGLTYRLPADLPRLLEIGLPDSLAVTATVTVDSVAARAADTLVYLTVKHPIGPAILPASDAGDSATIELAGSQAASLVWSTGWNAFVSGAGQARVVGRLRSVNAAGTPRMAELRFSVSTRLQVRL
jgi:hypothetical protein